MCQCVFLIHMISRYPKRISTGVKRTIAFITHLYGHLILIKLKNRHLLEKAETTLCSDKRQKVTRSRNTCKLFSRSLSQGIFSTLITDSIRLN